MASVNKIIYGGNVLLDLTGDTVTPQTLAQGATAHNAAGEQIVGTNPGASGDMKKSDYDPDSNISNVGRIEAYFTDAVNSDPAETTPESILSTTEEVLRKVYPVGAVYMSVNSADPADLFGFGTWERVKDRFLLAAGDAYAAGSTGGEAAHTLTVDEMPKHNHDVDNLNASGNETTFMTVQAQDKKGFGGNVKTMYAGGGKAHSNMPPYLAVYMWQRIS